MTAQPHDPFDNHAFLVPSVPEESRRRRKDVTNRLTAFADWLTKHNLPWYEPHLQDYRDSLLLERDLAPTSVNAHLATIRGRYRTLLEDGTIERALRQVLTPTAAGSEREARVKTIIQHITDEIEPEHTRIRAKFTRVDLLRPRIDELVELLNQPDRSTLVGLRDAAVMALLLSTGIRNLELCALNVIDLYGSLPDGSPALHVPGQRGGVERLVPYAGLEWGLQRVQKWLSEAELKTGPVFRGFYKGSHSVRPTGLKPRAVETILQAYPLGPETLPTFVRPMDLRRAHARILYEAGVSPATIQERLGLKQPGSVVTYIGGDEAFLWLEDGPDVLAYLSEHLSLTQNA